MAPILREWPFFGMTLEGIPLRSENDGEGPKSSVERIRRASGANGPY